MTLLGHYNHDFVHLLDRQQRPEGPWMAGLPTTFAAGRNDLPFLSCCCLRRVRRGRSGGVGGILADASFQLADALLQRGNLRLQPQNERLSLGREYVPEVPW
jgi:hypothetical protein